MPTFTTDLPPEIQAQYDAINRRNTVNDALMSRALQSPQTQMTGGRYSRAVPFSPIQGGLNLVQVALAKRAQDRNKKALNDLAANYQTTQNQIIEDIENQRLGRGNYTKADLTGAMLRAATDPYAMRTKYADYLSNINKAQRGGYSRPLDLTIQDESGNLRTIPGFADTRNRVYTDTAGNPFPPGTTIVSAKDPLAASQRKFGEGYGSQMGSQAARGGSSIPGFIPGVPQKTDAGIVTEQPKIPTEADLVYDKDMAQSQAGRTFNMSGIGQTVDRAKELLTGIDSETGKPTGDLPTQSWVGAAQDFVGSVFGVSPKGAKEASALEAIGGALVAKMPRMEGQQSDRDLELYKEMAAKIGNRKVPIDERLFALNEVERLWRKYEDINIDNLNPGEKNPPLTNKQGWKLMKDANGNQAYVGPNGEIEEVK